MTKPLSTRVEIKTALTLGTLALALLPAGLQALPDHEPFNYASGAILPGQVSPGGFPWTAAGPAGTDVRVESGNLVVPGLAPSVGNRIVYQNILGPSARFNVFGLSVTTNAGTIYYSFAFQVRDLTGLGTSGGFMAGLNNATGTQPTTPTTVGTRVLTRLTAVGAATFNVGLDKSSGSAANFVWDSRNFTVNDVIFVVGSYTFNTGTTTDDKSQLWINPDPGSFGASAAPSGGLSSITGNDLGALGSFVFFQRNAANVQPNAVIADELRIGTSWAAVTPPADTTPPVVLCPPGTNIVATSAAGAVVNYSATATDNQDPSPVVTCNPPSGTTFPLGTTTVDCSARDASGNVSRCAFTVTVLQPPAVGPEYSFGSNILPPTNGLFLTLPKSVILFPNGLIVRDVRVGSFSPSMPPPPPGGSRIQKFEGLVEFEHSMDGGQTFSRVSAPAALKVMIGGGRSIGTITTFDTEMLQLDIMDGTLPPGVVLRESPSKASLGKTSIRTVPGSYMIGSFFDIFTELSLDGGQTWSPAGDASHVELRMDPASAGVVSDPSPVLPPPTDMYASPAGQQVMFAQGIVLKDIRNKYFSKSMPPPNPGEEQTYEFTSQMDMQISMDGGSSFRPFRAPASAAVHVINLGSSGQDGLYDTEMLALDIHGGDLPPGVMLRESPTLPSRGGLRMDGQLDGSSRIGSFFDVFTEISFDGGQTWSPAQQPARVGLQKVATGHLFTSQNLPAVQSQYISPADMQIIYANGMMIRGVSESGFTQSQPPPPPGGVQVQQFSSSMRMMLSSDGGQTWTPVTAIADASVRLTSLMDSDGARFFDTEMLQLDIHGGGLPAGVMVRESPTRASLGRTSLKTNPASGQTLMESFFDIFTELTMDGGQTWNAATTAPGTVGATPSPFAAFTIYCPSNMTITATSSNGATANFLTTFLYPDCPFGPFVVTCTPPSGSIFPIGTTTVHCVGSDGCGEHPTCSFDVTVRPRLQFSGVINSIIGKAILQPVYPPNPGPPPHLRVSNLGSSGQDGVSIDAIGAESVLVNFVPFQVDVGTCAVSRVLGPSDLTLSEGTFFGGASPNVHADFSGVGSSQCLVQVRDEFNNVVHSSVRNNGAIVDVNSFFPTPCPNGTSFYSIAQGADFVWYKFCRVGCFCAGTNCTIERTICLRGINPSALQTLARLEIRAQGVDDPFSLEIVSEEFSKFGRYHLALGDAELGTDERRLPVRNLGSSGQDGVSIDFLPNGGGPPSPVDRYSLRLLPVEVNCPGGCLRLSATGDFAGDPKHPLGSASMVNDGQGNLQMSVDFSPIGSSSARVDVYEGSKFIGTANVQGNFIGTLTGGGRLIACGKLPPPLPCFFGGFETSFKFEAADGTSLVGDEIRILAGSPSGPLKNLASFSVQACNVGQITIVDEVIPPPLEIDYFRYARAKLTLKYPNGQSEEISLDGTTQVEVSIAPDGSTTDSDGDGLDDSKALMTMMDMHGTSSQGVVAVSLDPAHDSVGQIEELANNTPGVLDVPPFTPTGSAFSFFDVVPIIQVGAQAFHPAQPLRLQAIITHKPPAVGETYANPPNQPPVELLDANGRPTGITITGTTHTPNTRECVSIICPSNIVKWTCNADGMQIQYAVSASNACDTGLIVSCSKPSGSFFPPGNTLVQCVATDTAGNSARCEFTVTVVVDTQPPRPVCPNDILVRTCADRELVVYAVTATDDCDPAPEVVCNPPSGSPFPAGTTTVTCIATDSCGHENKCSFHVTVVPEPLPKLTITPLFTAAGYRICWSTPCPGYVLQCSRGLEPPILWETITNAPVVSNNTNYCITLIGAQVGQRRFYRVIRQTPNEVYSPVDTLPPVGTYSSAPGDLVLFANGIVARWFINHVPVQPCEPNCPAPPCATCPDPIIFTFGAVLDVQYSTDGGQSFVNGNVPGTMRVAVHGGPNGQVGTIRTLDTEILSMDMTGGTLPPGVMLRESPTRASTGKHRIRSIDGGFMIASFFDVFLELSVDGGNSWSPSLRPVHVEYLPVTPQVQSATDNFPLIGTYASPPGVLSRYGNGVVVRNFRHTILEPPCPPECLRAPPCLTCPPDFYNLQSQIDLEVSTDSGQTFQPITGNALSRVWTRHSEDSADTRYFETEMLSMEFSGGAAGVMLRESPTRASTGKTTVQKTAAGGYRIGSFFDVFTEISLDGGVTWSPAAEARWVEYLGRPGS